MSEQIRMREGKIEKKWRNIMFCGVPSRGLETSPGARTVEALKEYLYGNFMLQNMNFLASLTDTGNFELFLLLASLLYPKYAVKCKVRYLKASGSA